MNKEQIAQRLEETWLSLGDGLYSYVYSILKSSADTEDVLQNVFIRLARSFENDRSISNLRPYLYKMARNEAIRQMEKLKKLPVPSEDLDSSSIEGSQLLIEEERDISQQLKSLPSEQSDVIILKLFHNLTFKEVAKITETTLKTVASRYRYGLQKLKGIITGIKTKEKYHD